MTAINLDIKIGAHGGRSTLSACISIQHFPSISGEPYPSLTKDLCQRQSLNPTETPIFLPVSVLELQTHILLPERGF